MITDKYLRLSEDQAITASAVTTNTIDLSQARDIGEGKPLYMVFTITETFATLTSLAFNVVTDDNASLSSPAVINTVSVTRASGGLASGEQIVLPIPPLKGSKGERYLGGSFTVTGSDATAGKVTVDIVETFQDGKKFYPSGYTV